MTTRIENEQEQRSLSISMIRLISLIMIITCHIMLALNHELAWWFNVGVQIFLCISGYLYGSRDIGETAEFLVKRIKRLLVPYYPVFLITALLHYIFFRDIFDFHRFIGGLFAADQLVGGDHLWFVPTILLCYILTVILQPLQKRYVKGRASLCLFMVVMVVVTSVVIHFFLNYFNPAWISCYVIGYVLGINKVHSYISERYLLLVIGILAVVNNSIQIYCTYYAQTSFFGFQVWADYNHVLLGVFLFLLLHTAFSGLKHERAAQLLHWTDSYSYEIYLVHQFLILGPLSLMQITPYRVINIVIICIGSVLLAYILKFVEKIMLIWDNK